MNRLKFTWSRFYASTILWNSIYVTQGHKTYTESLHTHVCVFVWEARKISVILERVVCVCILSLQTCNDVVKASNAAKWSQQRSAAQWLPLSHSLSPPQSVPLFPLSPGLLSVDVWLILSFSMALNCFLVPPLPLHHRRYNFKVKMHNAKFNDNF